MVMSEFEAVTHGGIAVAALKDLLLAEQVVNRLDVTHGGIAVAALKGSSVAPVTGATFVTHGGIAVAALKVYSREPRRTVRNKVTHGGIAVAALKVRLGVQRSNPAGSPTAASPWPR